MVGGFASAGLTTLAVVMMASISVLIGVGVAVFVTACAWLLMPQRKNGTPKLLILLILGYMFSSLLPSSLSFGIQAFILGTAVIAWHKVPATDRRGTTVVYAALAILAIWAALIFHSNVPDMATGLLGFRKTAFCVVGVIAGCAVPRPLLGAFELTVARVLIVALGVSIVANLFIPGIEGLVSRSADEYTSLYAGEARLQGVFAGPFHAALGAMLLLGWGMVRINIHRMTALIAVVVGVLALYLTLVRSAYVGVGIMVIALIVIAPNFRKFLSRAVVGLVFAVIIGALIFAKLPSLAETALSIFDFASDGRFLNRLPEYAQGITMIQQSPIIGMGSGSAGDTLEPAFVFGEHVTPHNMILKVIVEGGIVGALAWLALTISIIRRTHWFSASGRLSIVSFAALLGLGLTGSAIDTLPISFFILFFSGLAVDVEPACEKHVRLRLRPLPNKASQGVANRKIL